MALWSSLRPIQAAVKAEIINPKSWSIPPTPILSRSHNEGEIVKVLRQKKKITKKVPNIPKGDMGCGPYEIGYYLKRRKQILFFVSSPIVNFIGVQWIRVTRVVLVASEVRPRLRELYLGLQ